MIEVERQKRTVPSAAARKSDPSLRMTEIEVCDGGFRGDESWAEGADNVHPFA
jgi:hypothetical protein